MKFRFHERIQAILPFTVPLGIVFLADPDGVSEKRRDIVHGCASGE
jgi:hypothetical protein